MSFNENTELMNAYLGEVHNLSNIASNLSNYITSTSRDMNTIISSLLTENSNSPFTSRQQRTTSFIQTPLTQNFGSSLNSFRRRNVNTPPLPFRPRTRLNTQRPRRNITEDSDNEEIVFTGLLDMTPIPVYPSITQIMNATEMLTFGEIENPINSTCPITMDSFSPSERVCQIKHCKHIFKERSLYTWFSSNIGCPVCRFDIRDDPNNSNTPNENYTRSGPLTESSIPEQIMTDITQLLSQNISRDISNSTNV